MADVIKIFNKEKDLQWLGPMSERIADFLCMKSLHERVKHDHTKMTLLGNVSFWIQTDPNNGDALLCYTRHPKLWDMDAILEDLEEIQKAIYIAKGVDIPKY